MGYGSASSGRWIFFQEIGSFYIPDDLLAKFDNAKKTLRTQKENSHFYNLRVVEIRQKLSCLKSGISNLVKSIKAKTSDLAPKPACAD